MATFTCDLDQPGQPFPHFWEHTVGSGHAALALRADWQEQIKRCRRELGFRHVRFHALLSDEMGTVVRQNGRLLYSFFNVDHIFDFLLSIDVRRFIELSFMPRALASGNKTVFSYQGNVTPPENHHAWAMLIHKLATHWVKRYGPHEVRKWFFEVWNEPNLKAFWTGTQRQYFELSNPRDPLHDKSFAAAYATKIVLSTKVPIAGYSFWTFSDIFNENYFPSIRFHGGFGLLNLHGIPKPVYRAFELLHRLGTQSLTVTGRHSTMCSWAFRKGKTVTAVLVNHAMPGRPIRTEKVSLRFDGKATVRRARVEIVDSKHANPRTFWESMGRPEYLTAAQVREMEQASRVQKRRQRWTHRTGETTFQLRLAPHSIVALTCEFNGMN